MIESLHQFCQKASILHQGMAPQRETALFLECFGNGVGSSDEKKLWQLGRQFRYLKISFWHGFSWSLPGITLLQPQRDHVYKNGGMLRSTRLRPDCQISQAEMPALVARSNRNPSTFQMTLESGPKPTGWVSTVATKLTLWCLGFNCSTFYFKHFQWSFPLIQDHPPPSIPGHLSKYRRRLLSQWWKPSIAPSGGVWIGVLPLVRA